MRFGAVAVGVSAALLVLGSFVEAADFPLLDRIQMLLSVAILGGMLGWVAGRG